MNEYENIKEIYGVNYAMTSFGKDFADGNNMTIDEWKASLNNNIRPIGNLIYASVNEQVNNKTIDIGLVKLYSTVSCKS